MIKFVMCCMRRSDMTREEFQDYWLNSHAPFYMESADVFKTKKYVQSHTLNTPLNDALQESRGMMPAFDGVAEVWFESEESLMEAMGSAQGQELGQALLEDENNFIDHARSVAFIVKEHEF